MQQRVLEIGYKAVCSRSEIIAYGSGAVFSSQVESPFYDLTGRISENINHC